MKYLLFLLFTPLLFGEKFPILEKHENGRPKVKGEQVLNSDGDLINDGTWIWWHENGAKMMKLNFTKGKLSGSIETFDQNKNPIIEYKLNESNFGVFKFIDNGFKISEFNQSQKKEGIDISIALTGHPLQVVEFKDGQAVKINKTRLDLSPKFLGNKISGVKEEVEGSIDQDLNLITGLKKVFTKSGNLFYEVEKTSNDEEIFTYYYEGTKWLTERKENKSPIEYQDSDIIAQSHDKAFVVLNVLDLDLKPKKLIVGKIENSLFMFYKINGIVDFVHYNNLEGKVFNLRHLSQFIYSMENFKPITLMSKNGSKYVNFKEDEHKNFILMNLDFTNNKNQKFILKKSHLKIFKDIIEIGEKTKDHNLISLLLTSTNTVSTFYSKLLKSEKFSLKEVLNYYKNLRTEKENLLADKKAKTDEAWNTIMKTIEPGMDISIFKVMLDKFKRVGYRYISNNDPDRWLFFKDNKTLRAWSGQHDHLKPYFEDQPYSKQDATFHTYNPKNFPHNIRIINSKGPRDGYFRLFGLTKVAENNVELKFQTFNHKFNTGKSFFIPPNNGLFLFSPSVKGFEPPDPKKITVSIWKAGFLSSKEEKRYVLENNDENRKAIMSLSDKELTEYCNDNN